MSTLPIIHTREIKETKHGTREWLDLEFSNGERRRYELCLPKGRIDQGESILEAANR